EKRSQTNHLLSFQGDHELRAFVPPGWKPGSTSARMADATAQVRIQFYLMRSKSGRGRPHFKTLARCSIFQAFATATEFLKLPWEGFCPIGKRKRPPIGGLSVYCQSITAAAPQYWYRSGPAAAPGSARPA